MEVGRFGRTNKVIRGGQSNLTDVRKYQDIRTTKTGRRESEGRRMRTKRKTIGRCHCKSESGRSDDEAGQSKRLWSTWRTEFEIAPIGGGGCLGATTFLRACHGGCDGPPPSQTLRRRAGVGLRSIT